MIKKITDAPLENLVLWNAFARNFSISFSTLYISAIFMIQIGSEKWPMILLYVQFFCVLFIILTNFIKDAQYYLLHKLNIGFFLTAIILYAIYPQMSMMLTVVAVMIFVMDIIGEMTATKLNAV